MDGPIGMVNASYQINSYAETYAAARELAEEVRKAMDGYSGTVNSRKISGIFLEDEGDLIITQAGTDKLKRHAKRQTYTVWYHEDT